jgi:PIN domain nuclease of toxin-antitoxin system
MILLDTHIWLRWIIQGEQGIPAKVASAILSAERAAVSAISCWEVEMLHRRQRIELPVATKEWLDKALEPAGIACLPVTCEIGALAAALPDHHRDPADRIIIATALAHNASLLSLDSAFPLYEQLQNRLIRE